VFSGPIDKHFQELVIDANFIPQFSETPRTNLIDRDEDYIAAFVDARLREVMQNTGLPRSEPTHDDKRIQYRLADLLFIHSIRAHLGSRSETCKNGLLRAIFDPQIGSALKSMHERLEHRWTVESLAASSGMSRSAFAVRFKDLVGETPLEYLTGWRMQKATGLLQKGDKKVFEVTKSPLPTIPTMPLAKRSSEYSVSHPGSIDEVPQGHRRVYLTQVVALKFQYGDGRFRLSAHRHNSRIRLMGKCTAASAFLVLDPRN
jgi:AraC-like DNA-binding protein